MGAVWPLAAQNETLSIKTREGVSGSNNTGSSTNNRGYGLPATNPGDSTQSNQPNGIVFDNEEEADSLLATMVYSFCDTRRAVKLFSYLHPSLMPDGVAAHNPIQQLSATYYIDLGALGQSHLALTPYLDRQPIDILFGQSTPLALTLAPDVNVIYSRLMHRYRYFQTLRPYTLLRYGSSLNKDYQISIIHTQNIKPRWNVAFQFDQLKRDGVYTNSGLKNSLIDITTNYYSADARYQLQAGLSRQNLVHEENGGVADDTTWWHTSKPSGVPVNMYAAANQWRNIELYIHQSFNTVRQFEKIRPIMSDDSIVGYDTIAAPQHHTFNTGVMGLDMMFKRQRRNFYDSQANSLLYSLGQLDSTVYYDSTSHISLSGDLYWTNDAYMQSRWANPLTVTIGVRPEIDQIRYITSTVTDRGLNTYARVHLLLGSLHLAVDGEEVAGGIRGGDYRLNGVITAPLGGRSSLNIGLKSEALAPALLYYHNEGCYSWNYADDTYRKIKQQQAGITYSYYQVDTLPGVVRNVALMAHATRLSDNVWFNSLMVPTQGNESGLLLQGQLRADFRFGRWLHLNMQEIVQYSNNDNVVRVPTFASKQSLFADLYVFKRALHLQTGADMRYHTRYYADGWNPVLGAFYRQDEVKIGNYFVVDVWLTLQVKRASIYLRASHLNALLEKEPTYFSLPHYPLEDFGLYWGVIWKFFN